MPVASNVVAQWLLNNSFVDTSGNGYDLVQSGTVPFITTPTPIPEGTHAVGITSDTNYMSAPAGLLTAISSKSTLTIEGFTRFNPVSAYCFDITAANGNFALELRSNGVHRIAWAGGFVDVQPYIGAGMGDGYYFFSCQYGTGGVKFYWSRQEDIASAPAGTNAATTTPTTVSAMVFGRASFAGRSCQALDRLMISTAITNGMPTFDKLSPAAVAASSSQINLSWTADAKATQYLIYRNTTNNSSTATLMGATTGTTFQATGLSASTLYYFWVKCVGDGGNIGDFSVVASDTTTAASGPGAPTSMAVTATGKDTLRLSWIDGASTDILAVYRNTANNYATASIVGSAIAGDQLFNDSGLAASTLYYYWLVPSNETAVGAEAGPASGTTLAFEPQDIATRPSVPDLPQDLVLYFAANVLKSDSSANFTSSYSEASPVANAIPLFPAFQEDLPNECGYILATENEPPNDAIPIKEATCQIFFRASGTGAASNSGRQRAEAMAHAVHNHLRPDGRQLLGVTLTSGRHVESFYAVNKQPVGEDAQGRYLYLLEFTARFRDIDVP